MNPRYKTAALGILDRMEAIAEDDLLVLGEYAREASENICGKNRYCAIGSALAAGRVPLAEILTHDQFSRDYLLDGRPSLRLALEYLDAEARRVIDRRAERGIRTVSAQGFSSPLERLFESTPAGRRIDNKRDEYSSDGARAPKAAGRKDLLAVIRKARASLEAA